MCQVLEAFPFWLAFFRALWNSELVARSKVDSSGWDLPPNDREILDTGVRVRVGASMTDQLAWGQVFNLYRTVGDCCVAQPSRSVWPLGLLLTPFSAPDPISVYGTFEEGH